MNIQELRIAGLHGIEIPDGLVEGSRFTITAELQVARSWNDLIDVSTAGAPGATIEGGTIVGTVLIGDAETRT